MRKNVAWFVGAVAAIALVAGCQDLKPKDGKGKPTAEKPATAKTGASRGAGNKVKLEMYVMSKCPFGVKAEQAFKPVLDSMGDYVDLQLDYIVNEKNGQLTSMHGKPELDGNIVQLCAIKHYPDQNKWMKFVDCQNKDWRNIPNNWEKCAASTGLDTAKLKACYEGEEGQKLIRESSGRAKKRNARGSPTIYLAGERYSGGRSKNDFMRAVCDKITGSKPDACNKLPKPVEVKVTILNDKRCTKCQTAAMERSLKGRFFPKLTSRTVDYSTDEGKKLYKELNLKKLPVWLFDQGVTKSPSYARISRWMVKTGNYYSLKMPAKFDPTAEICDNKKDDTGNGKVDCADETCKATIACRTEKKKDLQVFVMSQCPFGVKGVDAMKDVLENFEGKLNFDVHYIATKLPNGKFRALHGQPEVDENIRQLCAKKYYKRNNKYLDYIWCRNKNYKSNDWKGCATSSKMDAAKIEKCSTTDEGKNLLAEDIKIAEALGVTGSPTWLANNRNKFNGIAPNAIKSNVCRHNKDLPNCDKQLAAPAPRKGAAAPSCGN